MAMNQNGPVTFLMNQDELETQTELIYLEMIKDLTGIHNGSLPSCVSSSELNILNGNK